MKALKFQLPAAISKPEQENLKLLVQYIRAYLSEQIYFFNK
jgi:hypothetical protein